MPRPYEQGLNVLLRDHTLADLVMVNILSRLQPHTSSAILRHLSSKVLVPEDRVLTYVPPEEVSHTRFDANGKIISPREEKIPKIPSPGLVYIVIDHALDTGKTLQRAVARLVDQGADLDKIWYFGWLVDYGCEFVLEKAEPLIAHLKPINSG